MDIHCYITIIFMTEKYFSATIINTVTNRILVNVIDNY